MPLRQFELPATMTDARFIVAHEWEEGAPDHDIARFHLAFRATLAQHWYETRNNGDTRYVEHPFIVADAMYRMGFDIDSQIAALLHDVVENGDMTIEEIEQKFGPRVARMVAGHTKDKANEAGFFDQLYGAAKQDFEVAFTRLLDRWHNLLTLYGFCDPERRLRFLNETLGPFKDLLRRSRKHIPEVHRSAYDALTRKVLSEARNKLNGMK